METFPPLTPRILGLLKKLKAEIERRDALSAYNPEVPEINVKIEVLTVAALRSGLMKGPKREYERVSPGLGTFHPDLPPWAVNHFIKWIREYRAGFWGPKCREVLRKTGIIGIETGAKRAIDMDLYLKVLELRGFDDYDVKGKKKRKHGRRSWLQVIKKLGVKTRAGTPPSIPAFKKMLKRRYSFHFWEET